MRKRDREKERKSGKDLKRKREREINSLFIETDIQKEWEIKTKSERQSDKETRRDLWRC